jgi:hypothetical protein
LLENCRKIGRGKSEWVKAARALLRTVHSEKIERLRTKTILIVTMSKTNKKSKNTFAQPAAAVAKPESVMMKPSAPVTRPAASVAPAVALANPATPPVKPAAITAKPETARAEPRSNRVCLELVKPEAKNVCVAGSFNQWTPEKTPLVRIGNGKWIGNLTVTPGRHEYLFVVDGQWVPDPNARETVQNPFGGKNSVLIVSE